jgi:hypothetical protein
MVRLMYDGITVANVPSGSLMVAGYLDGHYANISQMRARFPHATVVEVAVSASTPAARGRVLDVETGDATAAQAVSWCLAYPGVNSELTVYCDASTWPSVRAAFQAAKVSEPNYWIASYDGDPAIPAGAIAKQYATNDFYDTSVVADYWPGVDPVPAPPAPPVPVEDPVTPADAQMFVNALLAAPVVEAGDAAPAGRTVLEVLAYQDQHYHLLAQQNAALSAQVTALSAALAAVAKGEAATVEAAVAAALKAAGHVVA